MIVLILQVRSSRAHGRPTPSQLLPRHQVSKTTAAGQAKTYIKVYVWIFNSDHADISTFHVQAVLHTQHKPCCQRSNYQNMAAASGSWKLR